MSKTLDAKGLLCPEPVLRAHVAMKDVPPGETLTVLATDPAAILDFPYYCHKAGLELLSTTKQPGLLVFEILKPHGYRRKADRYTSDDPYDP